MITTFKTGNSSFSRLFKSLWEKSYGDPRVCIAVLDGPVDIAHPVLKGANIDQLDTLVSNNSNANGIASQHGTHVTSVLFGQPQSPVQGIVPSCKGIILPIYADAQNGTSISCSQVDLARAITQAVQKGAHIINISGGEITPSGKADPLLENAIQYCKDSNVLVVAAAGNEGCNCLHIPAALPSVLAVGAMDENGNPDTHSNWGKVYTEQGILASGKDIMGAIPGGGTAVKSGTSFATPLVSGTAALLLSLQLQQGEKPNPHAIREILLKSAVSCEEKTPGECKRFLRGKINPSGALQYILKSEESKESSLKDVSEDKMRLSENKPVDDRVNVSPHYIPDIGQKPEIELDAIFLENTCKKCTINKPLQGTTANLYSNPNKIQRSQQMDHINQKLEQENLVQEEITPSEQAVESSPNGSLPNTEATVSAVDEAIVPQAPPSVISSAEPVNHQKTSVMPGTIKPSDSDSGSLVYALGKLGVDFGTDTRRDWFNIVMNRHDASVGVPEDNSKLLEYMTLKPYAAASAVWTLNLDATPVYAIEPQGAFGEPAYELLRAFLAKQIDHEASFGGDFSRVVVPGIIQGNVTLRSGQVVPKIAPDLRGLEQVIFEEQNGGGGNIEKINQIYFRFFYELRNLGVTPQDRAKNSMTIYSLNGLTPLMLGKDENSSFELERVHVERSPICRPNSDCWDVVITTFNPKKRLEEAKLVFRLTIDVKDIIPVQMGKIINWSAF